jgi:hypothetical protein
MKESYSEGIASHTGPESCAGGREVAGEALIGVRAGRVLSREIHAPPQGGLLRGADVLGRGGRPHRVHRQGKMHPDPARSQTPYRYGNNSPGTGRSHGPLRSQDRQSVSGGRKT